MVQHSETTQYLKDLNFQFITHPSRLRTWYDARGKWWTTMATCLEYQDQRTQECTETADEGFQSCQSWNPWFSWICIFSTWVSNIVCVGWTWVTTSVCVLWDTVVTVVDAILVTLEGIGLGWLLNLLAGLIELIFTIPVLGGLIEWIWNVALTVLVILSNILDILGYAVGVRPQKKLRVCAVVLLDSKGTPVAATEDVLSCLNTAIEIYFDQMNVAIIRSAPFQYSTGFLHPGLADQSWITTSFMGDDQLTGCCDLCQEGEELWLKGSRRKFASMIDCFWGNWRRLLGVGAPVVIFVIQSFASRTRTLEDGSTAIGQSVGCGLGPLTNFIAIAATAPEIASANPLQDFPNTTAHELGHICNLWHLTDADNLNNLMFNNDNGLVDEDGVPLPVGSGSLLFGWQSQIVRMSRHVSYF